MDSLLLFKEFFCDKPNEDIVQSSVQNIPLGRDEVDEEETARQELTEDDWNDALYSTLDKFETIKPEDKRSLDCGKDVLDSISNNNSDSQLSPKTMQEINEKTPVSQMIGNSVINASCRRKNLNGVRKMLNFDESRPKNFKLSIVYAHMIGCEAENQHSAESDCISVLRCICQIGKSFAEWADYNALSLNLFRKKIVKATTN